MSSMYIRWLIFSAIYLIFLSMWSGEIIAIKPLANTDVKNSKGVNNNNNNNAQLDKNFVDHRKNSIM